MSRGRVEARITVPTGGWSVSLTVTAIGGPVVVTVAAGTYWIDELLVAFIAALNAAFGGDGAFSYSVSFGESGTGFVTITHATQTFSWTWTSTAMRDLFGFTADLTPAALSFTGTMVCKAVWLPDCDLDHKRGVDSGPKKIDRKVLVAPGGTVTALGYQNRRRVRIVWALIGKARAIESQESTVGESFERWFLDTHGGEVSYFGMSPQVRVYWNADGATKITIRLIDPSDTFDPERVDATWIGLWVVVIEGYIVP